MGKRSSGSSKPSLGHRLRRYLKLGCDSSSRHLQENDCLVDRNVSFDENDGSIATYKKPSPSIFSKRSVTTTANKADSTLKPVVNSKPPSSRSIHSAVTQVRSNVASSPSSQQLAHPFKVTNTHRSSRTGTTTGPHVEKADVGNSSNTSSIDTRKSPQLKKKPTANETPTKLTSRDSIPVSDDGWGVFPSNDVVKRSNYNRSQSSHSPNKLPSQQKLFRPAVGGVGKHDFNNGTTVPTTTALILPQLNNRATTTKTADIKMPTTILHSPDSVVVALDNEWSDFPSSSDEFGNLNNSWYSFDGDANNHVNEQHKTLPKTLFPTISKAGSTENIPDPDFHFPDEEEEDSFFSENVGTVLTQYPTDVHQNSELILNVTPTSDLMLKVTPTHGVPANTRHTVKEASSSSSSSSHVIAASPSSEPTKPKSGRADYGPGDINFPTPTDKSRSPRVGITPSPKWAADSYSSQPGAISSLTSSGAFVPNEQRSEGGISSIGILSVGSAFRNNNSVTVAAAAVASAQEKHMPSSVGDRPESKWLDLSNEGNRRHSSKMNNLKKISQHASSKEEDDEAMNSNSDSSSESKSNSFLFEAVENILGPRTMSADMESLGGRSLRSGGSATIKSALAIMRNNRNVIASKKSEDVNAYFGSLATTTPCITRSYSNRSSNSLTPNRIKPIGSTSSLKATPSIARTRSYSSASQGYYGDGQNASVASPHGQRAGGDNATELSRVSNNSSNSYKYKHDDVTTKLLQLEGKLMNQIDNSGQLLQGRGVRSSEITSTTVRRKVTERQIVLIAPPGRLGVILSKYNNSSRGTVVSDVREFSPLRGKIGVGDRIIAVDNENVAEMTVDEITQLMATKSRVRRRLTVLTTRET